MKKFTLSTFIALTIANFSIEMHKYKSLKFNTQVSGYDALGKNTAYQSTSGSFSNWNFIQHHSSYNASIWCFI